MKILIAHNSYQHQGGEDAVVNAEIELLRNHGHEVAVYRRHNREIDSMSRIAVAGSTVWSQKTYKEIEQFCDHFQPDLIHGHNTFPLISPSLYWAASCRKIPVVQTLHNFRLICPQAMLLREGKICEDCIGKLPWRGITRSCYRDSAIQSGVIVSMLATHRAIGTYRNHVAAYIALSEFSREKFIAGGLPAEKIQVKPNFVEAKLEPNWSMRDGGIFVGRLSFEKGLDVLIEAEKICQSLPDQNKNEKFIRVIGGGALEEPVQNVFKNNYLGYRTPDEVCKLMHASQFLIAPSTCYETFGLVAVEAYACGVPVIASRHGGLAELIKDGITGLLFTPGDAADLARKIVWARSHPEQMVKMGRAAYTEYLNKYTPERNYHMLHAIYQDAIPAMRGEPHAA
ncbi:MAG TPA: glycosyltransferase [Burkholderiaceae bacterium]|jgi:glycosyltransferase involved in cell wall biosynthesis